MKIFRYIFSKLRSFLKWFQNASLKKKLIVVVAAGILLFLISGPLLGGNKQSQITTDTVKRATIIDTVSESGNIQSNQLTVYSVSDGVIEELYVENGQTVQKGDKLFKVKSTASDQDKAEAWASYQSAVSSEKTSEQSKQSNDVMMWQKQQAYLTAQQNVKNMEDNMGDYKDLERQAVYSAQVQAQKDFAAAEQKYKESDTSITSAKAQLNSAWIKYQTTQDAIVTAQVSGVIANLSYSVGDQVTASMNASSNTDTTASSVLVIGTETENVVKIQINEVDVNKVKVGQEANVTISAIKDKTFKGEVTRVDDYGTDTSGVITYNVFVKVANPDEQIRPLMSAVVVIQTTKHENALVVSNSAVKPYKGGKAVQVRDISKPGNQLKYLQVKTGIKNTSQTEILEGVTEGTEVVTSTSASSTKTQSGGGILGGPPGN
jgi:multidrug efflux pump subunit AcrA (membrane-fusion protein)